MDSQANVAEHSAATDCYQSFIAAIDDAPKSGRIEAIDDLIHRLQFERRWQQMADNQIKHMCDESLSDAEAAALAKCATDRERDERIEMYARARYFRRCAWITYLNGETDAPPVAASED